MHHSTIRIEREYPVPPATVFHAWADPAAKAKWFVSHGGGWRAENHALDFRTGGSESLDTHEPNDGPVHAYHARYYDIVPDERIVYAYEMIVGGERLSVSLATVQLAPTGSGTRLTFTEQVTVLSDYDGTDKREAGTKIMLDALGKSLQ